MDDLNAPATKGDLVLLRGDLDLLRGDLDELRAEMNHQFDDLKETLRDVQTEILKAFYGYTQTTDIKLKEGEQSDIAIR